MEKGVGGRESLGSYNRSLGEEIRASKYKERPLK